jgi:hypothetical protein
VRWARAEHVHGSPPEYDGGRPSQIFFTRVSPPRTTALAGATHSIKDRP